MQVMIVTLLTSYYPCVFSGSCCTWLNDWCKSALNIVTSKTAHNIPYKITYATVIVSY
jgi:hypothetical protein